MPLFEDRAPMAAASPALGATILRDDASTPIFVRNLELLSEAAGGPTQLRRLVLAFAVRGALVPQRAMEGDGNSAVLRAKQNETELVSRGQLRRRAPHAAVEVDEQPFPIPRTWAWVRFGELGDWGAGATPARGNASYYGGTMPWFKSGELNDAYVQDAEEHVTELALRECSLRVNQPGDVLIAMYGATIGKVALARSTCTTNQAVCACTCFDGVDNEFLLRVLKAFKHRFVEQGAGGAQPNISRVKIVETACPLPPLAEQKRIVARVDQLMALIDDLEAKQTKKRDLSTRFTKASLEALTTAESPEAFDTAWQRVVENFPTVIDSAEKVDDLRRNVLRLAARGRLVAPRGRTGGVDNLLERTEAKRVTLVAQRKASRRDDLPPVSREEELFSIPDHWRWARLGVASICRDGQRIPVSKEDRSTRPGPYDYYGASGVIDKIDQYIFDETLLLIGEDGANLLSRSTPIAFLAGGQYWVNNHAHVLDSADVGTLRYLALYINAIDLAPYVTGTAQPKMNQAKMNMIPVALPPPEEQALIVAKVEYLMKLCDDLEAKLRRAEDRASKLVEAVVQEMVS